MTKNKINYGEYAILGINKAFFAFLISFIVCLTLSIVINTYFYQEIVALTIGSIGESSQVQWSTILRTTTLILGLSTFQKINQFQMGALILAIIPFLSFLISGFIFRVKKPITNVQVDLKVSIIIDGLATVIYTLFMVANNYIGRGELFGIQVDFVSWRNVGFSLLFILFVQYMLGINRHDKFTLLTSGLMRTRKLLQLILGFSALIGVLFVVYFSAPYLKGAIKIIIVLIFTLPNLAVYLSFLFMGISMDYADALKTLTDKLSLDISGFVLPTSIKVALIVSFILLVFILLLRIPVKKYWQNLLVFVLGFSASMWLLAIISRTNLGFTGALNIHIEISPWKAFLVPFVIITLNGLLLALLRLLCIEVKGEKCEKPKGFFSTLICGLERESSNLNIELNDLDQEQDQQVEDFNLEDQEDQMEVDIWKELAARPIPQEIDQPKKEIKEKPNLLKKASLVPEENQKNGRESYHAKIEASVDSSQSEADSQREVDIRLFPRNRKKVLKGIMDFSDMEDEVADEGQESKSSQYSVAKQKIDRVENEHYSNKANRSNHKIDQTMTYVIKRNNKE